MDRADASFRIDSYKFLPRSMIPEFKAFPYQADDLVTASPLVSLKSAKVALLTSGGLYLKDRQSSFDLDRERHEPFWGDPTYRLIPRDVRHGEIAVAHLHLNPDDILADFNVALPLEVFVELEREREIGVDVSIGSRACGPCGQSQKPFGGVDFHDSRSSLFGCCSHILGPLRSRL